MTSAPPPKIVRPTLLVDKTRCVANLRKMKAKADQAGVRFRPHCKTHASVAIGLWMKDLVGVECITVSSLTMAEYFAPVFDDITVAFSVNILEIDTINRLNRKVRRLNLLVENVEAIDFLQQHLELPIGMFLKIDVGYGRTGIPAEDTERVLQVLQAWKRHPSKLLLRGLLTHAGQSYDCQSRDELLLVHQHAKELLLKLREKLLAAPELSGVGPSFQLDLSIGDTPTCSVVSPDDWKGLDEVRPGNFVFYDAEQAEIGSCTHEEIAVAVACPIVAKHFERRELVLYGGGIHLSKDRMVASPSENDPKKTMYGRVVRSMPNSPLQWGPIVDGMYLRSTSQEHGIVVVPPQEDMHAYRVGDILKVLPVHSCMTADVMSHRGYLTTDGEWISRMED